MSARPTHPTEAQRVAGVIAVCYLGAPLDAPLPAPDPCIAPECAPPGFDGEMVVVAVDGGLDALLAAIDGDPRGLPPGSPRVWNWIGDGDSLSRASPEARAKALGATLAMTHLPVDKDVSDFGAALDALAASPCLRDPWRDVVVVARGGIGGRRDHELCNLLEAVEFVEARRERAKRVARAARFSQTTISEQASIDDGPGGPGRARGATVVTFPGAFHVVSGRVNFAIAPGARFTLASPRGKTRIAVEGAAYSGDIELRRGSHGLSNVAFASTVMVSTDGVLIVALA